MINILIAFIGIIGLLIFHELGHFVLAKKFGVRVEEFGIGYPPRILAKKIGQTLYSLNWLPFGAFLRIYGERKKDKTAFGSKPFWQQASIVLGGVVSFWLVATILLSIVMALGFPQAIEDDQNANLINPRVQIVAIAPDSPAEKAGLEIGDTINKLSIINYQLSISTVKEVQNFVQAHKGEEIIMTIKRGQETFDVSLIPRVLPPEGEGAMGVGLARISERKYVWYQAPFYGFQATADITFLAIKGWLRALKNLVSGLPTGVQMTGPIGVFSLLSQASSQGLNYFFYFLAIISIYVALFNALPIPAVDGGKLVFLIIERIRGKEIPEQIEKNINSIFFLLLIALMILITIKDIARIAG